MLSPSDFNNAVPQFTNGDYASNPINPQYIAEPDAVDYNRGAEPLQTLPAQWWNWFLNKFTNRFNKVNIYVKNIFNELTQLLSLVSETPSGTEGSPTVEQLKTMFACCYPSYVKETEGLVPNTTTVNGHALTGNIAVTRSDLGLGTSATVNTGSGAGCIPTVGTALGSTANKIVLTTASGTLQPSSSTVGSAAYCDASCFRASSWTPTCVACAACGSCNGTYKTFGTNAFNSTAFTTCTGTVTQVKIGTTAYNPTSGVISLPAYPTAPTTVTNANKICTTVATANSDRNLLLGEAAYTGTCCAGAYVGNSCKATFNPATGVLTAKCFCGCATDSAKLGGKEAGELIVSKAIRSGSADYAETLINFGDASSEIYGGAIGRHLGPLAIVRWVRGALQCDVWKALEYAVGSAVGCAAGTCARPLTTMLSTCYVNNCCNYIGATGQISSSCSDCQQATNNARIFINSGGCETYISFSGSPTTAVNVYRGCSNKIVAGSYEASGQVMFSRVPY